MRDVMRDARANLALDEMADGVQPRVTEKNHERHGLSTTAASTRAPGTKSAPLKKISATHHLKVRYGETDQMGVVYHPNYLVWFHEARDALLNGIGVDVAAIERRGYQFPVIDTACRYLRSARFGDEIRVKAYLYIEEVARMRFGFDVFQARNNRLLASGTTVSVVTDSDGKLLLRLPDALRHLLLAAVAATTKADEIDTAEAENAENA